MRGSVMALAAAVVLAGYAVCAKAAATPASLHDTAGNYVVLDSLRDGTIRARVSVTQAAFSTSKPGALIDGLVPSQTVSGTIGGSTALTIDAGPLRASIDASGLLVFARTDDGSSPVPVLSESARSFDGNMATVSMGLPDRVYGFGEHESGRLDSRGLSYDMETCTEYAESHGGEICLPFILGVSNTSNAPEYGLLWNMPNFGGVSFGADSSIKRSGAGVAHSRNGIAPRRGVELLGEAGASTSQTWVAYSTQQYEVVVSVPSAPTSTRPEGAANDVLEGYTAVTGTSPHLPTKLAGYIHSRNRYSNQTMLLDALEGFVTRNIPLDVIVIDYFNWPQVDGMGDWRFDPTMWPAPTNMTDEVASHGVSIMVSAWPFTANGSDTYDYMAEAGLVVVNGSTSPPSRLNWPDVICQNPVCSLYDPTQEAARAFYFSRLAAGYISHGIDTFWLDAAEPENVQGFPSGSQFALGSADEVGMMFPFFHTKSVFDGLRGSGKGDGEIFMLTRSGWAGQSRHAASVWSGDTKSTFPSLAVAQPAGLNAQMSGVAWWTLDIGGYSGGDPSDPTFNRLIVRWFEYGLTLPIFRQHGHRETEPWVLASNASYTAVVNLIRQRYQLAPYVLSELNKTSAVGTPLNRPLWWDFPSDAKTAPITTTYMFGSGFLTSPVLADNVTSLDVYLPAGDSWIDCSSGTETVGGTTVTVPTPLGTLALFKRASLKTATDALLAEGAADPRSKGSSPVCGLV